MLTQKEKEFIEGFSSYLARYLDCVEDLKPSFNREDYQSIFADRDIKEVRRLFRCHHVRIGVRDLLKFAGIDRILRELSFLADAVIERVLEIALERAVEKAGLPPVKPSCCVVALGKLGAEELNYYSDVDLMYIYSPFKGTTDRGKTDAEFYSTLFSEFTRMLSEYSESGVIYNVDLRLRPHGRKGLICMTPEAYRVYYETCGRTWERAMLIRARCCAGDGILFDRFWKAVKPFVYRKYLDYEAIEEIKRLKDMIDEEGKKSRGYNIKTGIGGIREIEFIVHAFLLVFGGKNPWLQARQTLIALNRIHASGLLGAEEHSILTQAYRFYRKLENRLQMQSCTQTHTLPENKELLEKLGRAMGFREDPAGELLERLEVYRSSVRRIFENIMETTRSSETQVYQGWKDPSVERLLEVYGEEEQAHAERLLSLVIEEAQKTANPVMVVKNLADLSVSMKHSIKTFYELLIENDNFRKALVEVLGNSQYLARMLINHPELLESLFERGSVSWKGERELVEELMEEGEGLSLNEKEEILNRFKLERELAIGISYLAGSFNMFQLFNEYTKTAEVCVKALNAWLTDFKAAPVLVMGMGKLGSRELTYHSDLDIVILSNLSMDYLHQRYYTSLIKLLPFEVDTRLRPFGTKGVMVNSPKSLKEYLLKHGRAWEKLAYSRARVIISDDEDLKREAEEVVKEFVYHTPVEGFEEEIYHIRQRMERELSSSSYDLKYAKGGLVDIEFIAQYLAVKYGIDRRHPLSIIKEASERGIIPAEWALQLKENYKFLRNIENTVRLIFYPPLRELPGKGKKLTMLARVLNRHEHEIIDTFMEVKQSNRRILEAVLAVR